MPILNQERNKKASEQRPTAAEELQKAVTIFE